MQHIGRSISLVPRASSLFYVTSDFDVHTFIVKVRFSVKERRSRGNEVAFQSAFHVSTSSLYILIVYDILDLPGRNKTIQSFDITEIKLAPSAASFPGSFFAFENTEEAKRKETLGTRLVPSASSLFDVDFLIF